MRMVGWSLHADFAQPTNFQRLHYKTQKPSAERKALRFPRPSISLP